LIKLKKIIKMNIAKNNPMPRFYQLTEILRREITTLYKPDSLFPSQNELMKKYGVSYGTVIRALNELIKEKLIYREHGKGTFVSTGGSSGETNTGNQSGRVYNHSNNIGIIIAGWVPEFETNPYFMNIKANLTKIAYSFGYNVTSLSPKIVHPAGLKRFIHNSNIDGLIIFNPFILPEKILAVLESHFPVIITEEPGNNKTSSPWVEVDSSNGIRLGMDYLLKNGHKRIALLNGNSSKHLVFLKRLEEYKRSLLKAGIVFEAELVAETPDFSEKSGYAAAKILLQHSPTAMFVTTSPLTIGSIKYIKEKKLDIPSDISIIGYDDPLFFSPAITTVQQPIKEFAMALVKNLIERIRTGKNSNKGILLKSKLVINKSVKKLN